nr:patatin-like phospholipase family protein [Moraxella catarrhalis]
MIIFRGCHEIGCRSLTHLCADADGLCQYNATIYRSKLVTPNANKTCPVVALVLGGGGMRGFAHIGAIESLEAHGIRPDMVVGTSWGTGGCSLYQW